MTAAPADISPDVVTALVVLKVGILVFGGLITHLSYKAYRTTGSSELRSLAAEFAIVTFGALLGGFADQILTSNSTWACWSTRRSPWSASSSSPTRSTATESGRSARLRVHRGGRDL